MLFVAVVAAAAVLLNPVECIFNKVKPSVCFDEMHRGPCFGRFRRYYYHSGKAECMPFYYSGCDANGNNFETLAACQRMCRNVCTLPKKVGPCKAKQRAYFFDSMIGKCALFTFGGCEPNANNFATLDSCKKECPDTNPICMEESFIGTARDPEYTVKYAFNTFEWKCKPFIYNGEGGNNNNFDTSEECNENCPLRDLCRFPPAQGPCQREITRYHYDIHSGQCVPFKYGGCFGNKNNFRTKEQCKDRCPEKVEQTKPAQPSARKFPICDLPKAGEVEPSQKNEALTQQRFYYDSKSKSCKYFEYAGVGGNANNFESVEVCNLYCPIPSPCVEPLVHGSGSIRVKQWYYNLAKGICESFIYNGQGGNRNRFIFKNLCQEMCNGCAEEQDRGPCLGFQPRYSYNATSGECDEFIFGGCEGNRNKFFSRQECKRRCQ